MITLTKLKPKITTDIDLMLLLTAEERTRSRYRFTLDNYDIFLRLPRGTVLQDGDILSDENDNFMLKIVAKPEPVLTVFAPKISLLLRAAYHLGNRHVPVEITVDYLRLLPDSVLENMLQNMGLEIKSEIVPFQPESGAYGNHHAH